MKRGTDLLLKFKKLKMRLSLSHWEVKGVLQALWDFTAENALEGNIGRFTDEEIALGIEWGKDPHSLIQALLECGWIDQSKKHRLVIHDWEDHCEEYVRKRLARKRRTSADIGSLPVPDPGPDPDPDPDPSPGPEEDPHTPKGGNGAVPKMDSAQVVFDAWNAFAAQHSLPCVRGLTAGLRKTINTRLKDEAWRENWETALPLIAKSPFLLGQQPGHDGRRFKANIEFFLRDGVRGCNVMKLIAGNYAGHTASPGQNAGDDEWKF